MGTQKSLSKCHSPQAGLKPARLTAVTANGQTPIIQTQAIIVWQLIS